MSLTALFKGSDGSAEICKTSTGELEQIWLDALPAATNAQGLKWGRVARVGDLAPFNLPGLYRVSCLLSCSSKSHKIPLRMHQNSPFSDKKFLRRGTRPRIAGEIRLLFLTTLSTANASYGYKCELNAGSLAANPWH